MRSQEAGPSSRQVSPSLRFLFLLRASPWWLQRDLQAQTREWRRGLAATSRGLWHRSRERAGGAAPSNPPALLPPHLQILKSLVHGIRVRETARPERSEVGWVKLQVLLSILKVIVKPGPFLFIPQDGSHGSQALLLQISVLCGLDVIPWGETLFRLSYWEALTLGPMPSRKRPNLASSFCPPRGLEVLTPRGRADLELTFPASRS